MKPYTYQYNKNLIHNLSDHTLTEEEFSVLTKGLCFVFNPTKTFKQEINKSWSKFKKWMLKQYFFYIIYATLYGFFYLKLPGQFYFTIHTMRIASYLT